MFQLYQVNVLLCWRDVQLQMLSVLFVVFTRNPECSKALRWTIKVKCRFPEELYNLLPSVLMSFTSFPVQRKLIQLVKENIPPIIIIMSFSHKMAHPCLNENPPCVQASDLISCALSVFQQIQISKVKSTTERIFRSKRHDQAPCVIRCPLFLLCLLPD